MTEQMMTVKELADHFRRSEDWVRALMKRSKLLGGRATPSDIKGALVMFPRPLDFLTKKRTAPATEPKPTPMDSKKFGKTR